MTQYLLVDIKDSARLFVFIFMVDKEEGYEHFNSLLVSQSLLISLHILGFFKRTDCCRMAPITVHCVSVLSTLWRTDLHLSDVQIFILCSLYIILSCGEGRITVTIIFASFNIPVKQIKV